MRLKNISLAATIIVLTACSVHKLDIQQGNIVDPRNVNALAVGMTKKQVSYLLGNPLLLDPFHTDRWDYIFAETPPTPARKDTPQLSLYFEDDKLVRIDKKP